MAKSGNVSRIAFPKAVEIKEDSGSDEPDATTKVSGAELCCELADFTKHKEAYAKTKSPEPQRR